MSIAQAHAYPRMRSGGCSHARTHARTRKACARRGCTGMIHSCRRACMACTPAYLVDCAPLPPPVVDGRDLAAVQPEPEHAAQCHPHRVGQLHTCALAHIGAGTRPHRRRDSPTLAPGISPHLHRDWAASRAHLCRESQERLGNAPRDGRVVQRRLVRDGQRQALRLTRAVLSPHPACCNELQRAGGRRPVAAARALPRRTARNTRW
jgi:hypothetical protein